MGVSIIIPREEKRIILFFIISDVEKHLQQPTSQNIVPTFNMAWILVGVCNRTSQDQNQYRLSQLAPQVGEHLCARFFLVVLLIELLDTVGELWELIRLRLL